MKKILIAEDEKAYSRALVLKLGKAGYDVKSVENGEEALALLKNEKFDLLLLDLIIELKVVLFFTKITTSRFYKYLCFIFCQLLLALCCVGRDSILCSLFSLLKTKEGSQFNMFVSNLFCYYEDMRRSEFFPHFTFATC